MNLGNTILRLRKEKGLTQEELAMEVGVSAQAVSKWENGNSLPDIYMLNTLADYFKVSTDELLSRKNYIKKVLAVVPSKNLLQKLKVLSREYGYIITSECNSYEEAVRMVNTENLPVDVVFVCGTHPNPSIEDTPLRDNISVLECVGENDNATLCEFEMLFRNVR